MDSHYFFLHGQEEKLQRAISLSMHLWVSIVLQQDRMWTYPLIVLLLFFGYQKQPLTCWDQNPNFTYTSMQLFYISFPLEGTKELIPCISSQTVSTQPNNGLGNAGLHTQRQMSSNGWTFPGSNALFQISRDHRIMFLLECRLNFTFQQSTIDVENSLFCRAI